jgi:pimeloyl-ACP methyl ester carboxylesterase
MTVAPERTGAIIGTLALEGEIEGGRNPRFTMWIRPDTRALYSVEITDYSFGLWQQRAHPSMRHSGTLLIQRVSQLPELPIELPPGEARRTPLEFIGADGMTRKGTLILPKGEGPYPCFVLHSPGGAVPRWDPGDAFAERGWAVYAYDKRGIGESEGAFDRGSITALAADAVAAGEMLVARPELDPKRIVFLGLGEAGKVGAVAVTATDAFAAAVLGSCAWDGKAFPDLAQARIRNVLAPFHQWDEETIAAYQKVSISEWEGWLYQGQGEVSLLKRRVSLRGLREMAQFDLYATLSESRAPVLLLHGQDDDWTPVEGIERLRERGVTDDGAHLTIQVFQGLGADLGGGTDEAVFAPVVEEAIFSWLDGVLKEGT